MSILFTNILIPVDFSKNTDVAVSKVIELAEPVNSSIHLFHSTSSVLNYTGYSSCGQFIYAPFLNDWSTRQIDGKMQTYKDRIKKSLPMAEVVTHIITGGSIQQNIIEAVNNLKVQLVIVAKRKSHKWLSFLNTVDTSFIAKKTQSVLLTIKPGVSQGEIKSVVLPVRNFIPERKIELLSAITQKSRARIYLATTHDKKYDEASAFVSTYRMISEKMHYPVDYKILEGRNFPKAILEYARKVSADIILANPYAETRTNTISGTDICDLIPPSSKLSVLTAEPFHQ